MSDTTTIFADLNQLALRLGTLLSSRTARKAPEVARKLRAEKELDAGIQALVDALNVLASTLKKLQEPFKKVERLAAGCEAVADSLAVFGDGKSLDKVAKLCGQSDGVVQPIVDRIDQVRGPLMQALGLLAKLPTPSELAGLCEHLTDLADDLRELKPEVENRNASISIPTPSTPGGKLP